ncbi:hypothetical protein [Kibdelosporangium phytohabitans]|uniref:Uncharacterized protein n=1 Tax=Kibdelosporangium phytohabitans TaxID=860235 RepID=A0A0N9I8B7_9PSEU|nr:hypothetical protein [Kibdelosporangium phytohabitans]ALG11139.1 hypothetical protein AOZ06_33450 [Kibdelosporangium phytohabitans]MBE1462390.1 hypothetical protein [Kibdelosporangium phytohabitans]
MTTFDPNDRRHGRPENVGDEAQAESTRTRDRTARNATPEDSTQPDARAEEVRAPEAEAVDNRDRTRDRTRDRDRTSRAAHAAPGETTKLFEETEAERYRLQWRELQASFVDEPRETVREAETLVNQMVESLTAQLNNHRQELRSGAETDDTERLRVVMQRYRSLFDQMLSV